MGSNHETEQFKIRATRLAFKEDKALHETRRKLGLEVSLLKQTIAELQSENKILTDALIVFIRHTIWQTKN